MKNNFLEKSLSDIEKKAKGLNFCKKILESKDLFSIKIDKIDKTIVDEISSFIKDKIDEYALSIVSGSEKDYAKISMEDWNIVKMFVSSVKSKIPAKQESRVSPHHKKQIIDKKKDNTKKTLADNDITVRVLVSKHAIVESPQNCYVSDIPLNGKVKVVKDLGENYRCTCRSIDQRNGVAKRIIFQIPKEDVGHIV